MGIGTFGIKTGKEIILYETMFDRKGRKYPLLLTNLVLFSFCIWNYNSGAERSPHGINHVINIFTSSHTTLYCYRLHCKFTRQIEWYSSVDVSSIMQFVCNNIS